MGASSCFPFINPWAGKHEDHEQRRCELFQLEGSWGWRAVKKIYSSWSILEVKGSLFSPCKSYKCKGKKIKANETLCVFNCGTLWDPVRLNMEPENGALEKEGPFGKHQSLASAVPIWWSFQARIICLSTMSCETSAVLATVPSVREETNMALRHLAVAMVAVMAGLHSCAGHQSTHMREMKRKVLWLWHSKKRWLLNS